MRPLFFCHIPKTAGSTVKLAIQDHFGPNGSIVPDREAIAANGGRPLGLPEIAAEIKRRSGRVDMLVGHYHYSTKSMLKNPFTVVMLREPIARTISHLKHVVARHGRSLSEVHEYLDDGRLPFHSNLMTWMLAPPDAIDSDPSGTVERAKNSLECADVIGVVERFAAFREQMAEFGITIPIMRANPAAQVDLLLTPRHIETIQANMALDKILYEHAVKLVEARTGSPSLVRHTG